MKQIFKLYRKEEPCTSEDEQHLMQQINNNEIVKPGNDGMFYRHYTNFRCKHCGKVEEFMVRIDKFNYGVTEEG
jgi:hypothetical protein